MGRPAEIHKVIWDMGRDQLRSTRSFSAYQQLFQLIHRIVSLYPWLCTLKDIC